MTKHPPNDDRKERLARQLRANLARRKAQARSKRAGEEDTRPEGLDAPENPGGDPKPDENPDQPRPKGPGG